MSNYKKQFNKTIAPQGHCNELAMYDQWCRMLITSNSGWTTSGFSQAAHYASGRTLALCFYELQ